MRNEMEKKHYRHKGPFRLESGFILDGFELAYHSYGKLNERGDNVVWICHALTANSDAEEWWPGMVGNGCLFDPGDKFIICVNILGSCYGSTGPLSINRETGKPWYRSFPALSFRDQVNSFELLREHLGISGIHTIIGGSIGGAQALEYAIMFPERIRHLIILASSAAYSPWAIAFNQSQRLAIEADSSFFEDTPEGGSRGMRAARTMALLSYRNYRIYKKKQAEEDPVKTDGFRASSYQNYQGDKLVKRFNAYAYYCLTKLCDTHNVGRGRGSIKDALKRVSARTLVIGISSDLLFPVEEQKFLADSIPGAGYAEMDSLYGHDGFLLEVEKLTSLVKNFYKNEIKCLKK